MRAGRSEGRNALTALSASRLFSVRDDSEALDAIKKKRKLSPGHRPASPRSLSVAASPEQNARILTRFPFAAGNDLLRTHLFTDTPDRPFLEVNLRLRIGSPTTNCCSRGTLLHFGPKALLLSICYYHQDLHQRPLQLRVTPRASPRPPRPAYSLSLPRPSERRS